MIRDSGVTRTMRVAGESRTGQSVLLESPEPRQSVVLRNFTCLLLSELDSLCKWLHGEATKGEAQVAATHTPVTHTGRVTEAKPRQLWQISPVTPPPSKLSYLEGVLKFDCIAETARLRIGGYNPMIRVAEDSRTG